MEKVFYVKSLREEFDWLQTLVNSELITTQTTKEIFEILTLNPNTNSFWWPPRLCTTILDINYLKTYRPQWLIFTLPNEEKPDYIFPFDLNAISENNNPVVEYHLMWDEVHLHYNVKLIDDFMNFSFKSYKEMYEKLKNNDWLIDPNDVLKLVNKFRISKWIKELDKSKRKLVEYNEAIFLRPVKINPIAIFWDIDNPYYKEISDKYSIPLYKSAEDFYKQQNNR
jgi:hypothetical protein